MRTPEYTPPLCSTHTWTTKSCGETSTKVSPGIHLPSYLVATILHSPAAWEVENGQSMLESKPEIFELRELAENAQKNYEEELVAYEKKKAEAEGTQGLSPPFPPNKLIPYRPDLFGLDKARKDCRFEMIKIVREVRSAVPGPDSGVDG